MEAAAAGLRCLVNGGPLILLVVAVTGVLNPHLRSARVRVSACEREPGIVGPFITGCPRLDGGRRASRDSPAVYYVVLGKQARARPPAKARL